MDKKPFKNNRGKEVEELTRKVSLSLRR